MAGFMWRRSVSTLILISNVAMTSMRAVMGCKPHPTDAFLRACGLGWGIEMTMRWTWLAAAMAFGAVMDAGAAEAATWRFEFRGWLTGQDSLGPAGEREALAGDTAFLFEAVFREADALADPFPPGFAAYAPLSATMTLLGRTYDVLTVGEDRESGVSVMLFDPSNVFSPGFWAAGIHADPLGSDTGIIARFGDTDTDLSVEPGALAATTYGEFLGVGYVSGEPDMPGPGNLCWPGGPATCAVEPFLLTASDGSLFELAVASRPYDFAPGGLEFSATLAPVPLPGGLGLLASALGLGWLARRREV